MRVWRSPLRGRMHSFEGLSASSYRLDTAFMRVWRYPLRGRMHSFEGLSASSYRLDTAS